jgi:hypothetical protein
MFARSWNEDMEKLALDFYEDRRYIFINWQASDADAESLTDAAPEGAALRAGARGYIKR